MCCDEHVTFTHSLENAFTVAKELKFKRTVPRPGNSWVLSNCLEMCVTNATGDRGGRTTGPVIGHAFRGSSPAKNSPRAEGGVRRNTERNGILIMRAPGSILFPLGSDFSSRVARHSAYFRSQGTGQRG
jgi:hypothetical protein